MNVIYCRTAKASYNAIKNQIDVCEKFLKSIGMSIDEVYIDDGYSGLNAERPKFQEMMNNIDNIKSITVGSPDRLFRDSVLLLELYKELHKRNIVLYDAKRQTNIIDSMNKETFSKYISGLMDDIIKYSKLVNEEFNSIDDYVKYYKPMGSFREIIKNFALPKR